MFAARAQTLEPDPTKNSFGVIYLKQEFCGSFLTRSTAIKNVSILTRVNSRVQLIKVFVLNKKFTSIAMCHTLVILVTITGL